MSEEEVANGVGGEEAVERVDKKQSSKHVGKDSSRWDLLLEGVNSPRSSCTNREP